jgi:ribosomal protein S18 acetylase RimI-like enzyme
MDQKPVVLRPGHPTIEEGLACARLLDTAAEGFLGILFGRRAPELIAQAYTQASNDYSYENVLFAESDGQIVGMAVGFETEARRGFQRDPLRKFEGYPNVRAGILGLLARPMLRIIDSVPIGDFYLFSLAVDEKARSQGVGSALIEAMEERARSGGSKRFSLDVAVKNKGAQRLYSSHGFRVYAKWPKHLGKRFGLFRMAKSL